MITVILLLGITALSAVNVDDGNQTSIEQKVVSDTTSVQVTRDVEETVSNTKTNEIKKENYEKEQTKSNTNNKIETDTTHSKDIKQTPSGGDQPGYIYCRPHDPLPNRQGRHSSAAGTINDPTDIYSAVEKVQNGGVIYLMANDYAVETVYQSEANAIYLDPSSNSAKTFTIMGEPGAGIVWSGSQWHTNMLSVSRGYDITVRDLTFRDGNASGINREQEGTGTGATADRGGAIDNRGTLHVINCTFQNISANQYGGAIANYEQANTIVENCTFIQILSTNDTNTETTGYHYGGAISLLKEGNNNSQILVKDSNFINITGQNGAVFLNDGGIFTVENVSIINATSDIEGGAIINYGGTFSIKNANMTNLRAHDYGGAVAVVAGSVTMDHLNLNNVSITGGSPADTSRFGGVIYIDGTDAQATITNSNISNVRAHIGGVFSNNEGILVAENNNISNVDVNSFAGVLGQYGYFDASSTLKNNYIFNATASDGQENAAVLFVEGGELTFEGNTVANCSSRSSTLLLNYFGMVTLTGNNIINNSVDASVNEPGNRYWNYLIIDLSPDAYDESMVTLEDNYFENNTDNNHDILIENPLGSVSGNKYINNTLSYNVTIDDNPTKLIKGTSDVANVNVTLNGTEKQAIVNFELREVYPDLAGEGGVKNGTVYLYFNDQLLDQATVVDSHATLTIDPSYFTKYNNTVTLNYTSDKHFLNGTYQFYVYNVINTTVSVNVTDDEGNPREPIQNKSFNDSFDITGILYGIDGQFTLPNGTLMDNLMPIGDATINITIEDDLDDNGNLKVYHTTTDSTGKYTFTIPAQQKSIGIKEINVIYGGETDHYNASSNITRVNIVKREVLVTLNDIADVNVRETAQITGTVTDKEDPTRPITSGSVILTITDENGTQLDQVTRPVETDGSFSYDYPTTTTVLNTVSVEFIDDEDRYEQVEQAEPKDFNVNQLETIINIDVDPTQVYIGDEIEITGILTEADGTTPLGDVDITINVGINNEPMTVHVNPDGTFTAGPVLINATTDYNITATYEGNNTYLASHDTEEIEIKIRPIPTKLTITSDDVSINETNIVNLLVTDNDGNPLDGTVTLSVDGRFEDVEIIDGVGVYEYKNTQIGKNVTISGYFVEDTTRGYLRSPTEKTEFEVKKIGTAIEITTTDDVTAHKEATATFTLTNGTLPISGELLNIEIMDEFGNILATELEIQTNANGQAEVKFTPVSSGEITIFAEHVETEVYNRSTAQIPVAPILSIETTTTVTATNTTINGTSVITVVVTDEGGYPVKGQVQLTIDGQELPQTIETDENGIATYEYGPTDDYSPTAEYKEVTVSAKFIENATHGYKESTSQPTTFTVDRLNTTIDIATEPSIKAHNKTNATITLSNSTGHLAANEPVTVIVTQGGEVIYNATEVPQTTDANGQVKIEFTPINTEDIEITVNYAENEVYNANSATKTLTNIKSMKTTLEITSENVAINETAEVTITVTDELDQPVNGTVLLMVDGNFVEVEVINGEAIYDYTNTHEGKNVTISGYFKEDEDNGYKQSNTDSTTFEVEKLPIAVDVEVDTTPLTAHEDAVATITLTDPETGDIIPGEEVNVVIRDGDEIIANITDTADENGNVFVDFVPESGEDITIVVEHPESSAYQYADNKDTEGNYDTFAVDPLTVNIELTTEPTIINGTSPVVVKVTDEDGNPVEGVPVELTLDDGSGEPVVVTVITDENGIATYPYDDTEEAKTVTVTAEVKDDSYEPKSDVPITDTFDVDRLDVNIDIIPEEDVIAGIPTSADISIATEDDIVPVGEKVKVTITQDGVGNPLYTGDVVIDEDGVITIPFTPENSKDITIEVTFDETPQFNANSDSATVTVDTKDTVIEIDPVKPVTAHKETSATITLSSDDEPLPEGTEVIVTITQNGNPLNETTATIDENGQVTVQYTPVNTDDVVITAEFTGNDLYNPSKNSATVGNIRPIDTVMTITADDVSINETVTIIVEVVDAEGNPVTGTAIITVDGQLVEVEVTDGVGEYPYTNTSVGKNVTVTGYFADNVTNGYIRSPVTSDDFEVKKLPINLTLEVSPDLTAHVPATATVTLTNDTDKTVVVPGEEVTVVITDEAGNVLANVTAKTDDDGQVVVDFTPITDGEITVDVVHPENDVYLECAAMAENTVEEMDINVVITSVDDTEINGTTPVEVVVTDEDGNPVGGVNVTLTFTDKDGNVQEVNVTTDDEGKATILYDDTEEGKKVTVTAEVTDDGFNPISDYPATDEFEVTKLTPEINIIPEDDVTAHKPTSADITIATEDGIVPVGETVTVIVTQDGVDEPLYEGDVVIDEDGVITIPFTPENSEDITISVTFDETPQFNEASEETPITDIQAIGTNVVITPVEDTIVGGTTPIDVVVTDDEGNPVAGVEVNLTIVNEDGEEDTITIGPTDENGMATVDYINTTVGKNVTVTAKVLADEDNGYAESEPSESDTFEVAKLDTTIEIEAESPVTAHKETSAT
ncbi:MAG: hypothetical protein IJJ11_03540, partial [Methanosphaera sp.]|nr:hypothetical protein [Methanosphaera sp.]